ncbi:hypothetical protein CERSUDRAFT_96664 [Gelatoporia subvermispora B]|uniref:F-box domain-containing protein n=1 Tax=Ceriporiopsis subvermispora (strain B) TaxID=914234 RepID=M2R9V6_CERS8|nr:hypothetical protein CERSUDRAFT_96664 [Gelatoporia subvermispora B]
MQPWSGSISPDVAHAIIDFLHSDQSTLMRCSLVCKSWLPACRFHLFRDIRLVTRERLVQFNALGTSLAYLGRYVSSLSTLIGPEDDMQLVRSIVVRAGQFENLNELDYGPVERRLVDQDLLSSLKTVSTLRIRTREHLDSLESYTQIIRPFRRTRTLAFHGEDDISDSITAITRSSEALALSEVTQLELRLKHCPHLIDAIAQCLRTDILPSLHTLALGTTCQRTWVAFSAELNAREGAWQDLSLATYAKCKCTAISNTANNILPTPRITDLLPPCPNLRRLRLHAARNSIRTVSMMLAKYETHERLDEVNDTLDLTYGPSGAKMALHDWKALYRYLSLHQWKSLKRSTMTVITDLSPDHGLVQSVCDVFQGSSSPV